MGADQSSNLIQRGNQNTLNQDEWKQYDPYDLRHTEVFPYQDRDGNKINLLRNNREILEKHTTILKTRQEIKNYEQHIVWREKCPNLVQVKKINFKDIKQTCSCETIKQVSVFTQFIPYRLSQLPKIPFPFNLYVLSSIVDAFAYINSKYSLIKIDQNLININYDYKIKIWINSNLASQEPQVKYGSYSLNNQSEMLHSILKMVSKKTEKNRQITSIRQFLGKKAILNVYYVKQGIKQYAKMLNINIPNSLSYLTKVFQKQNNNSVLKLSKSRLFLDQSTYDVSENNSLNSSHNIYDQRSITDKLSIKMNQLDIPSFHYQRSHSQMDGSNDRRSQAIIMDFDHLCEEQQRQDEYPQSYLNRSQKNIRKMQ